MKESTFIKTPPRTVNQGTFSTCSRPWRTDNACQGDVRSPAQGPLEHASYSSSWWTQGLLQMTYCIVEDTGQEMFTSTTVSLKWKWARAKASQWQLAITNRPETGGTPENAEEYSALLLKLVCGAVFFWLPVSGSFNKQHVEILPGYSGTIRVLVGEKNIGGCVRTFRLRFALSVGIA